MRTPTIEETPSIPAPRGSVAGSVENPNGGPRLITEVDFILRIMGCTSFDIVNISREAMPDFDNKLNLFFREHFHTDDEVRLILNGSGYFDIRDELNRWIRIPLQAGDFLVLPAGMYHRFGVDHHEKLEAMRVFVAAPAWAPHMRHASDGPVGDSATHAFRQTYVAQYLTIPRPLQRTILGTEENGVDNLLVQDPRSLDSVLHDVARETTVAQQDLYAQLEAQKAPVTTVPHVVFIFVSGALYPNSNRSWCPSCVPITPLFVQAIQREAARFRGLVDAHHVTVGTTMPLPAAQPPGATAPVIRPFSVYCPVERTAYLHNPEYPYRSHPLLQITAGVPTIVAAVPTDSGSSLTEIGRFTDVEDGWLEAFLTTWKAKGTV